MKVIKRVRMNHMPMDRWDDSIHNYVHATGYAVVFDEGGCEIEYEDSNFEYSPDCETIEDGESYKKEERERKMKEEQEEDDKIMKSMKKEWRKIKFVDIYNVGIGMVNLFLTRSCIKRAFEFKRDKNTFGFITGIFIAFTCFVSSVFSLSLGGYNISKKEEK